MPSSYLSTRGGRLTRAALLLVTTLALAACNDAARCANYCTHLVECPELAAPGGCEDRCTDSLKALDDRCGEGVECPCNEAASSYYLCMAFAVCSDIAAGVACQDELAKTNAACPAPYTPVGNFTRAP